MAFKPIKASDTTVCISMYDPAIDLDATDVEKYAKESIKNPACFRDLVKIKDGERLTEFIIGVIPSDDIIRIQDECIKADAMRMRELRWRCFLLGVRDITNWPEEVPKIKRDGVEYVDVDWLKKNFVKSLREFALDIGSMVFAFNNLTGEETKN